MTMVNHPNRSRKSAELIRLALHYAIEERESFMECGPDPEPAARAAELVRQWKALLAKKYGEVTQGEAWCEATRAGTIKTVKLSEIVPPRLSNRER